MWWYGRGYSGGSWLPEEKKGNMWPGRGNSGGSCVVCLVFTFPRAGNVSTFLKSFCSVLEQGPSARSFGVPFLFCTCSIPFPSLCS